MSKCYRCGTPREDSALVNHDGALFCANGCPEEDPRKTGLKNGIRQLTTPQIIRTLKHDHQQMAFDHGNYVDGKFCPLAIGAGLDLLAWAEPPTDETVSAVLCLLGFKVNNTRGIQGEFFRNNRFHDYKVAAFEVLAERGV